jgi:hypothetical protein
MLSSKCEPCNTHLEIKPILDLFDYDGQGYPLSVSRAIHI